MAPAKGKNDDSYQRRVRFYYPSDVVQQWSDAAQLDAARADRKGAATVASLTGAMNPKGMNFDYDVSGSRFVHFRPSTIFAPPGYALEPAHSEPSGKRTKFGPPRRCFVSAHFHSR